MQKLKNIFFAWLKGLSWPKILIAVLSALCLGVAIIFAINPQKQFIKMRNNQRKADVVLILNALYQYSVDNGGNLPPQITDKAQEICEKGTDCGELLNLSAIVQKKKNTAYLGSMPTDPRRKNQLGTGYEVKKIGDRVTVLAPLAEQGAVISATR